MHKRLLVSLILLAASGCVTAKATEFDVPKERATECRQICTDLDMKLSAVVVILSKAGCVCEPRETEGTPPPQSTGASTAAGGAVIQAIAEAAQQQQQQQQRR